MIKLHALSYDLIITGQYEDSKRLVISIGDVKDHEAATRIYVAQMYAEAKKTNKFVPNDVAQPFIVTCNTDNGEASSGAAMLREDY